MSRHIFECQLQCAVRVRLGYDRPLNEFFLQVERIGARSDLGHALFLYASIHDPFNTGDDLDYYRHKLEQLGVVVPESLFRAVEEDAARGVGNRCAEHFADGRIVELPKQTP
jgi:hypothetical protein